MLRGKKRSGCIYKFAELNTNEAGITETGVHCLVSALGNQADRHRLTILEKDARLSLKVVSDSRSLHSIHYRAHIHIPVLYINILGVLLVYLDTLIL